MQAHQCSKRPKNLQQKKLGKSEFAAAENYFNLWKKRKTFILYMCGEEKDAASESLTC